MFLIRPGDLRLRWRLLEGVRKMLQIRRPLEDVQCHEELVLVLLAVCIQTII